ncbi:lysylphosphatidylglycerol synthase transmembrane domain-containing protein [Allosalinactinospora lopnorensis]|uniref:lysylphosphatidylglycerol synthase transmembrane domain-containing protein n=1 Tax=Allosalinactinospora lopnorensis TaxID=1352348 RepID=UPI000623D208|nr:lysylphosphatidylglycerol synthase transmembrane domain-containing protein [Allosalinactinospora lopnorensis]
MRRVWPWLRALGGAAILAALVWQFGTDALLDGLRLVDGQAVLAALGLGLLTTVFSAWRWCLIAWRLGLRLPLATAVADYYRALFLNVVLPAGVLGDAHRAVSHGRRSGNLGRGVRAVVLERVGGQIVLIVLGVAVLLVHSSLASAVIGGIAPAPGLGTAALGGLAVALALAAWARWGRSTSKWRRAIVATLTDVRLGLLARDIWPGVVLLSMAALAGNVALFLVAARTAGSSAPLFELAPLMVLTLLVMTLPVNVGGWGPREAFLALAFGAAGLGATQGFTTAVVCGVLTFVSSLPGAGVLLFRRTARARPEPAHAELEEAPRAREEREEERLPVMT